MSEPEIWEFSKPQSNIIDAVIIIISKIIVFDIIYYVAYFAAKVTSKFNNDPIWLQNAASGDL